MLVTWIDRYSNNIAIVAILLLYHKEWVDVDVREEYRKQRAIKYGGNHTVKGLLVLDAGPAHTAFKKGEQLRFDELKKEINIEVAMLDGGTSATLNACDQVHQV